MVLHADESPGALPTRGGSGALGRPRVGLRATKGSRGELAFARCSRRSGERHRRPSSARQNRGAGQSSHRARQSCSQRKRQGGRRGCTLESCAPPRGDAQSPARVAPRAQNSPAAKGAFTRLATPTADFRTRYLLLSPAAALAREGSSEARSFLFGAAASDADGHVRARATEVLAEVALVARAARSRVGRCRAACPRRGAHVLRSPGRAQSYQGR